MAKIKHIAISTQDVEATARFYIEVFGLKEVGKVDSPGASGYYLSDGDSNRSPAGHDTWFRGGTRIFPTLAADQSCAEGASRSDRPSPAELVTDALRTAEDF